MFHRDYLCQYCLKPKWFALLSKFQLHLRGHTGDRPFVCEACPKWFAQKSSLKLFFCWPTPGKTSSVRCLQCSVIGEMFTISCDGSELHHGVYVGLDQDDDRKLEEWELEWFCKKCWSLNRGATDFFRRLEGDVRISFEKFTTIGICLLKTHSNRMLQYKLID